MASENFNLGDHVWDGITVYQITAIADNHLQIHSKYTLKDNEGVYLNIDGNTLQTKFKLYPSQFLYRFVRGGEDVIDSKGKITNFAEVNVIADSVEHTRIKGNLGSEYYLQSTFKLGKDWQ